MRRDADDNRGQNDTVAAPIADWMAVGLPVYDVNGAKIGIVRRYDLEAGYMEVETRGLARKELYVPFHLMQSIDPREIYLRVSKDALTDAYLLPPAAKPLVTEQPDPRAGGTEVVVTHEIRSGYDGRPVQVAPVRLDDLMRTMSVGMTVLDVDGEYVGEVTQIDRAHELLTVRNSVAGDVIRNIPFSVVAGVDFDRGIVALLVPALALASVAER